MAENLSKLADELKPYMVPWVRRIAIAGGGGGGTGDPGGGDMLAHVLADTSALGPFHTVSGLTAGQVLVATGGTTARFAQLIHSQLGGIGANDHHNQAHAYDSTDHTGTLSWAKLNFTGSSLGDLATRNYSQLNSRTHVITGADHSITGAQYTLVGVPTTADTLGVVTPSADVSAGGTAILRSNAGALAVNALTAAGTGAKVRTPLLDTAAGDLTLSPAGNVKLTSGTRIGSDNYASQTTGWAATYAGAGDFRYLFTDEMHAKSFIADLEQALAGGQIISKSVTALGAPFTAPANGGTATLTVKDLPSAPDVAVFVSGDIVRVRTFSRAAGALTIADCWGVVTSYADGSGASEGLQTWTFTRSTPPNQGAMSTGTVVAKDSIVLDYGTSGNGFHEVNAIDGAYGANSPYAQIVTWSGHPATGQTVRTRTGNLNGIFGVANEFGLYAGSGVTDADQYLRLSSNTFELHNLLINMFNGAANTGRWYANGSLALSATSVTTADQRDFIFDSGAGVLRIGRVGANTPNLYWTGSALQLRQDTTPVITLDSDGTSYFSGPMGLGAAGGIYQGTGTFATPTTGMKIWNPAGAGRISNYIDGDEKVRLDTTGLSVYVNDFSALPHALKFYNSSSVSIGGIRYGWNGTYTTLDITAQKTATVYGALTVTTEYGYSNVVATVLKAVSGASTVAVTLDSGSGITFSANNLYSGAAVSFSSTLGVTGLSTLTGGATLGAAIDTASGVGLELKQDTTSILRSQKDSNDAYLQLGNGRTASGLAYIDLVGDTTYTNYGLRLIRGDTGANATSQLLHRGTGNLDINAFDAADLRLLTSNTLRATVNANGIKVAASVAVGGDAGGTASHLTLTNVFSAAGGAGGGTIKMAGATGRNNAGWVKSYNGTTEIWTPYWTTITG